MRDSIICPKTQGSPADGGFGQMLLRSLEEVIVALRHYSTGSTLARCPYGPNRPDGHGDSYEKGVKSI